MTALRSARGRALLGSSAQQLRQTYAQAETQVSAAARSGLERLRAAAPPCGPESAAAPSEHPAAASVADGMDAPLADPAADEPAAAADEAPKRPRSRTRRTAAKPATGSTGAPDIGTDPSHP
ncbi:MAG: hypothetical protein JM57_02540 [Comamonadaceae bacterium BICA1-1]|nr:MAG: hypothetical protein JM57_02540 [Comamonadaceae bacterium BICA1-1]